MLNITVSLAAERVAEAPLPGLHDPATHQPRYAISYPPRLDGCTQEIGAGLYAWCCATHSNLYMPVLHNLDRAVTDVAIAGLHDPAFFRRA